MISTKIVFRVLALLLGLLLLGSGIDNGGSDESLSTWISSSMHWMQILPVASAFPVEKQRLPGIWKLTSSFLPYEVNIREKLMALLPKDDKSQRINSAEDDFDNDDEFEEDEYSYTSDGILIKLNPDGSFKQCNEGFKEGRWIAGRWKLSDDSRSLILAMNRQYFGPQYDVVLAGIVIQGDGGTSKEDPESSNDNDVKNVGRRLKIAGQVQKGKFMYPQKHPGFFDDPLANRELLGPFVLEQSLASSSIMTERREGGDEGEGGMGQQESNETNAVGVEIFYDSDFYNRTFIMTIEPVEPKEHLRTENDDVPVDMRVMPIKFFPNNTFQAIGNNKILRGRFQVDSTDGTNKILFDVSLFGAGRSMPGSVYSEGLGLTHEDKRSYVGSIQREPQPQSARQTRSGTGIGQQEQMQKQNKNKRTRLIVDGLVTFGSDLGSDARPEPVGKFILKETTIEAINYDDDDDDDDDDYNYVGDVDDDDDNDIDEENDAWLNDAFQ